MRRTMQKSWNLAVLLVAMTALPALAATVTERIEKSFPLKAGGSVSVENVNGRIALEVWDKDEVRIVAVKTVKAASEEAAQKEAALVKVTFKADAASVSVHTEHPKRSFWDFNWLGGGASVDVVYAVSAPKGTKLSLESVNGAVEASAAGCDLVASTVNGAVTVTGAKSLEISTVNGRVTFDTDAVMSVATVNGAVEGVVRSSKPLEGSVETVNGSVELRFAADAAMRLQLENVNGSIESAFSGLQGTKHEKSGDVNGGGAKVAVSTVNGSIEVSKL